MVAQLLLVAAPLCPVQTQLELAVVERIALRCPAVAVGFVVVTLSCLAAVALMHCFVVVIAVDRRMIEIDCSAEIAVVAQKSLPIAVADRLADLGFAVENRPLAVGAVAPAFFLASLYFPALL